MNRIARLAALAVVGFIGFGICSSAATAAVVLDQNSVVPDSNGGRSFIVNSSKINGEIVTSAVTQSVTAGKNGYLDHIDIQLRRYVDSSPANGTVIMSLFDGDLSSGTSKLITSTTIETSSLPLYKPEIWNNFIEFDVRSADFFVTEGHIFSIVVDHRPLDYGIPIVLTIGSSAKFPPEYFQYSGGELNIFRSDHASVFSSLDFDMGFRTFVDEVVAAPVPEPASWVMMIGGLALVGAAMRRRSVAVRFA